MKKKYVKPTIVSESLKMDNVITSNCDISEAAVIDDIKGLQELGFFGSGGDLCAMTPDDIPEYADVCYHSNIMNAFTS